MMNMKNVVVTLTAVSVLVSAGIVYAATARTPAEIASGITGKTIENLITEREQGKTYGSIANEAGVLEEFQSQIRQQRKAILDQSVENGELTQEQADDIYQAILNRQGFCNGAGNGFGGYGSGFGNSYGSGNGPGYGAQNGGRIGYGCGFGR